MTALLIGYLAFAAFFAAICVFAWLDIRRTKARIFLGYRPWLSREIRWRLKEGFEADRIARELRVAPMVVRVVAREMEEFPR